MFPSVPGSWAPEVADLLGMGLTAIRRSRRHFASLGNGTDGRSLQAHRYDASPYCWYLQRSGFHIQCDNVDWRFLLLAR